MRRFVFASSNHAFGRYPVKERIRLGAPYRPDGFYGLFGRPSLLFVVSERSKKPELAAKFINFMLTDPEAGRILGLTRGIPAADSQYNALVADKRIAPIEQKAFLQIKGFKDAGKITLPSPLLESVRMQKLMREVFEQVAYGKVTDQEAAARLLEEGNTILSRLK